MFKNKITTFIFLILINLLTIGCERQSLEDFEEEGQSVVHSLIQDLQKIHNREELIKASNKLQKQFDRLVDIMIAAEELVQRFPYIDQKDELAFSSHELSDQLRLELNRLYELDGGQKLIEKYQEKALYRLDAFEKQKIKNH